ncbi:hypothetical protein BDN72DRAFT_955784 [Pluteus cervinus]|uniref:Uncharacterized protein n=1 Tax=Pluteus cervinus TaxID=181527 RepID=A0ACD3BBT3_9AGAR|nr:hypothetical protein BDN72DRAFT_955784 [Pluteus cervinus]
MSPTSYDPDSLDEQPLDLPSAPATSIRPGVILQPPLTRRGVGPALFIVLPPENSTGPPHAQGRKPLDPEPVQKWAEEGFNVVGITCPPQGPDNFEYLRLSISDGFRAVKGCKEVDATFEERCGIIVYYEGALQPILDIVANNYRIVCLAAFTNNPNLAPLSLPSLFHSSVVDDVVAKRLPSSTAVHKYSVPSPLFVLPHLASYDPGSAAVAHSRTLAFLRKWIGGPTFDLEAIWDEHTYFEFEVRSVAKTMATMVAEPYVNHVPTMTGGVGRKNLTEFYRDHFIFSNPPDTVLQPVSRTVGPDRVVDEFVFHLTHDRTVDWLLPGVPATGKKLAVPMMAVVNIRGDRLYNEHIWWDQGTVMVQAGIIPTHIPFPLGTGASSLRLPIAGVETARMLIDETNGTSNEMFGSSWGVVSSR